VTEFFDPGEGSDLSADAAVIFAIAVLIQLLTDEGMNIFDKSAAGILHSSNSHVDLISNLSVCHYWFSRIAFIQKIQPDAKQVFPANTFAFAFPGWIAFCDFNPHFLNPNHAALPFCFL